jgi:putative Holliday junction resolvase
LDFSTKAAIKVSTKALILKWHKGHAQSSIAGNHFVRILALDHGTKRIGIAVSDELRTIAQPLEFVPAEPLADFVTRLQVLLGEKEVELILVGMPRNMDGSYGPAAEKVREFIAVIQKSVTVPIRTWDERLTSAQANRFLIQGKVRRQDRKQKVDKTAAAILLQSYLDSLAM